MDFMDAGAILLAACMGGLQGWPARLQAGQAPMQCQPSRGTAPKLNPELHALRQAAQPPQGVPFPYLPMTMCPEVLQGIASLRVLLWQVYWAFAIRMCQVCRETHTIPGRDLKKTYGVPYGRFQHLRSNEATIMHAKTGRLSSVSPCSAEEYHWLATAVQHQDALAAIDRRCSCTGAPSWMPLCSGGLACPPWRL